MNEDNKSTDMIKVPTKTTVYSKEPGHQDYTFFFAPELMDFIKQKKKYKTYRYGLRFDYLKKGDLVLIKENGKKDFTLQAKITSKTKTTFKDLPLAVEGHEIYDSKEHQRKVLSGYYKFIGREIKDEDLFLVFEFKLID